MCWALDLIDSFSVNGEHSEMEVDGRHADSSVTHITPGRGGLSRAPFRRHRRRPGRRAATNPSARPVCRASSPIPRQYRSVTPQHSAIGLCTIVKEAHIAHQKSTWPHIPGRDPTRLNISGRPLPRYESGVAHRTSRSAFRAAILGCRHSAKRHERRIRRLGAGFMDSAPVCALGAGFAHSAPPCAGAET